MRILLASPRKAGNARLRCLLATAYTLRSIDARDAPPEDDYDEVAAWLKGLADRSIVNTSYRYTADLAAMAERLGIALVAILRHPFDLFVSNHDVAQQRNRRGREAPDAAWQELVGAELDDPAVMDYVRDGFWRELEWLAGWQESGLPSVRFEQIEADPGAALAHLSTRLGPLDDAAISHAVALCPGESVILSRPERGRRMPVLPSGAWRQRLPAATLALLQEHHAEAVQRLGYETV